VKKRSLIVETVARWIEPLIFLYGIYIVAYGHLSPGGGFPGGVILACAFILLVLARGKEQAFRNLPLPVAKALDSTGALMFLVLALLGIVFAGGFFVNFIQKAFPGQPMRLANAGTIPLCNISIALKVCASLFLAMVVLSALRVVGGGKESDLQAVEEE